MKADPTNSKPTVNQETNTPPAQRYELSEPELRRIAGGRWIASPPFQEPAL